ncbi:MAG: hypothetical protein Kow0090_18030 [Myxococcota bacterium]
MTEPVKKKRNTGMLTATIVMAVLALVLLGIGYFRGEGEHISGLKVGATMTMQIIPLLTFALIVAGTAQVLIPHETIAKWVGSESGIRGILLGSLAGGLTPGGPYVTLPLVAGVYKAGASVGTTVAFITGWSLWAVMRLPMEVGILGVRFTLIRLISVLIFPPIAGILAELVANKFGGIP